LKNVNEFRIWQALGVNCNPKHWSVAYGVVN